MVKRALAIVCAGLVLAACSGGDDGYSEEQCSELEQDLADARNDLNSYDRSTALGQTFYDGHLENVVRPLEIAYSGLCDEYIAQETALPVQGSIDNSVRDCLTPAPASNLAGCDLRDVDLSGVDLSGADLRGVNLAGANLEGANLEGANLEGANLNGAKISGANFIGVNLSRGSLFQAVITGSDFEGANLRDASLEFSVIDYVNLSYADLHGASLANAILRYPALRGTSFCGVRNRSMAMIEVTDVFRDEHPCLRE